MNHVIFIFLIDKMLLSEILITVSRETSVPVPCCVLAQGLGSSQQSSIPHRKYYTVVENY